MNKRNHVACAVAAVCAAGMVAAVGAASDGTNALLVLSGRLGDMANAAFPVPGAEAGIVVDAAAKLALVGVGAAVPDVDQMVPFLTHRTWTHSLWFCLAFLLAGLVFGPLFWVGVGVTLHVLADSFSKAGVAWLYPLTNYRRYGSGAFVKAGVHNCVLYRERGRSQYVVAGLFCAACAAVCAACAISMAGA